MKEGIGLRPKGVLYDVLVSRNWYKTVSKLYQNEQV